MLPEAISATSRLHANELYCFVFNEFVKNSDRIRSAAYAGDDRSGQLAFSLHNLRARFAANHLMKIPHHGWIRMSPQNASKQIMRGPHIGQPVAHGQLDGVFSPARTRLHP